MNGAWAAFLAMVRRDLLLTLRNRGDAYNPLLFFVLVCVLFPLGTDPRSNVLQAVGPAIIWVAALLACLLSLERIFRSDFDDGSLEQIVLSPHPTSLLVGGKVLAHWLGSGLLVFIVSPLLAVVVGLKTSVIPVLMLSLLLGTPILSLVGAIGVALTVGLRRGGVLLSLLVLPLYTPILIFGANAVSEAAVGHSVVGQLLLLAALLVLAITLAPLAAASALKVTLE